MSTTDHTKRLGRVKARGSGNHSNSLLAGVDDISVNLVLGGERPHSEHAVLALQPDGASLGDVVRSKRRDADAEVDVEAFLKLLRSALSDALAADLVLAVLARLALAVILGLADLENLNLLVSSGRNDAVNEDTGEIDGVGVNLADFNNVLGLHNGELSGLGHQHTISLGSISVKELDSCFLYTETNISLPEDAVSGLISLPCSNNGHITRQGSLHEECFAVELASLSLRASFKRLATGAKSYGNLAILNKGIFQELVAELAKAF